MKKMRTVQKNKNKNPKMASNRPIEKWYTNIHGESVVKKMEGHKQNMKFLKQKSSTYLNPGQKEFLRPKLESMRLG